MTKVIARFVSIRNSCGIFRCSSFKEGFECTNECLISYRVLVNHSALVTTAEVLKRVLSEQSACQSNIYYRNFADIKRMFRLGEGKNMPSTACCRQPRHKKCEKNYNGPWQRTRTRVRNVATRFKILAIQSPRQG